MTLTNGHYQLMLLMPVKMANASTRGDSFEVQPSLVSISTLRECEKCRSIIHEDNAETCVTPPRCDILGNLLVGITEVSSRLQMHLAINAMSLDAWDSWFDQSSPRWILQSWWYWAKVTTMFISLSLLSYQPLLVVDYVECTTVWVWYINFARVLKYFSSFYIFRFSHLLCFAFLWMLRVVFIEHQSFEISNTSGFPDPMGIFYRPFFLFPLVSYSCLAIPANRLL